MAKADARYGKCQFSKICFRDKTNKAIQQDGAAQSLQAGPLGGGGCARLRVHVSKIAAAEETLKLWVLSLPLIIKNKSALLSLQGVFLDK